MNANRLISMLMRRFTRQAMSLGAKHASKPRGGSVQAPEERQAAKSAQQTSRNAKKTLRLSRKIGRL